MLCGQANRQGVREPLSGYRLFHTADLDEARELVAKVYTEHELHFAGASSRRLDTAMCHYRLGGVSLNRLRYGGRVRIEVECLDRFLLVMMPITGHADIHCGGQSIVSSPQLGSVISPTLPLRETIADDCDQLMVQIDRDLLERVAAQHLGHELAQPLEFDLGLDMAPGASQGWLSLLAYLLNEVDGGSPLLQFPLLRAQIEHLVVTTLLLAQQHNYRTEMSSPGRAATPRHVRCVEEYIRAHAEQPLTVADLAAYAKVSTSSLYEGFREFRKASPMAYLKAVRLQRVKEDLLRAEQATDSVTEIALRWGFAHLGRFANYYKKMYGESPSETLRKGV